MDPFESVTPAEYRAHRYRRYGRTPGERMDNPLWIAAVKSQDNAFNIAHRFGDDTWPRPEPIWCYQRFGTSCTPIFEGSVFDRFIWIGGEHEDYYDPDFCIYNDVVVTRLDGSVEIYGFPRDHFPPTDFHSATLIPGTYGPECICIIGGLGYKEERIPGTTPVYALNYEEMQIGRIAVKGEEPGWIFRHQAMHIPGLNGVAIWGGSLVDLDGEIRPNTQPWLFNFEHRTWSRLDSIDLRLAFPPELRFSP